jgi:tRNA threonylcarbamoyladenosine biosynthesis protein TsaB
MRVLAIDTALAACSVAVLDSTSGTLLASESQPMTRGHAEALVPMIGRVITAARLAFADLDRIAVTVGPGSFTGLRVGVAAARGIALAAGKPAVALTTLAAFAAPHIADDATTPLLAAIDARNEQVYMQLFGPDGRTIVAPRVANLRDAMRTASAGPARLAGSGAALIAAIWPGDQPAPSLVDSAAAPDIVWIARLGAAAAEATELPKPLYLSAPSARPQVSAIARQ